MKFRDTALQEIKGLQEIINSTETTRTTVEESLNKLLSSSIEHKFLWVKNPLYISILSHLRHFIRNATRLENHTYPSVKPKVDMQDLWEQTLEAVKINHPILNIKLLKRYAKKIKEITGKELWELTNDGYMYKLFPRTEYSACRAENEQQRHKRKVLKELTNTYYSDLEMAIMGYINTHSLASYYHYLIHNETLLSEALFAYYVRNIENCTTEHSGVSTQDFFNVVTGVGRSLTFNQITFLCPPSSFNEVSLVDTPHNNRGAVLKYKDLNIYALEGRVFPKNVILRPRSQTAEEILKDDNAENRRIRITRYGWADFLADYGTKVIDKCVSPHGTIELLVQVELKSKKNSKSAESRVLCTTCPSTGRPYFLLVESYGIMTCASAQDYLRGGSAAVLRNISSTTKFNSNYPIVRA